MILQIDYYYFNIDTIVDRTDFICANLFKPKDFDFKKLDEFKNKYMYCDAEAYISINQTNPYKVFLKELIDVKIQGDRIQLYFKDKEIIKDNHFKITSKEEIIENKFLKIAQGIADLLNTKNQQYGSAYKSAPQILNLLYPNGVQPKDYSSLLYITRVLDKLQRIATNNADDLEDPFKDIAGYSILFLAERD